MNRPKHITKYPNSLKISNLTNTKVYGRLNLNLMRTSELVLKIYITALGAIAVIGLVSMTIELFKLIFFNN